MIPGLIIAANALVSNESKPTERIQMADVTCHGLTSSATSNLKGKPGEMLAKHQADVDSQYLTNCHKLDRKMGVGPADRGLWEEKLRDYGNPVLRLACGHCGSIIVSEHAPRLLHET